MSILVFGKSGQVARELRVRASVTSLDRQYADLRNPATCADAIRQHAPTAVINAAAYTAVDLAESNEDEAALINGASPAAMAEACAALGVPLVHISTDYVFGGDGTTPWRPGDDTAPKSAYGRTKLLGEEGVRNSGASHAILRTSWVFSEHGSNFVKSMLRLGSERDELRIVADQIGGPTPAGAIAELCLAMADQLQQTPEKSGTYHFSGGPDISWAGFAREIFSQAGLVCDVMDIASSEYPTAAARPENSRLDCSTTEDTFGFARPDWRDNLRQVLARIGNGETDSNAA